MFLSDLSIRRPVFAAVMMLALVTLGLFSYVRLPIEMEPDVEFPVVTVTTVYRGASPETIEREVTRRIEESVNPISGVKNLSSISKEGVSLVIIEFHLENRVNEVAEEVRTKISAIRGEMPLEIEDPIIQKLDLQGFPVISLAIRSEVLPPREISQLAERKIKRRLESLPGVGKVELVGTSKREIQIELDPSRIEAFGMGVNEVIAGLQSENVDTPLGRITGKQTEATLRVAGKPKEAGDFAEMVIANRNGHPITVGDVAHVADTIEEPRSLALVNGVPAVAMNILKQSGANVVEVVDLIKRQIQLLQKELPAGTVIDVAVDRSVMIRDSIEDLNTSILLGGLLTVMIVFCFLNSWRSTVITGLTLPISVISSFIVMNSLGMSLNIMTMMGVSLVIGLLIDDAIVVRENIVRHLEMGKDHLTAAREGTDEIGLAVLATTFSIIAVFVPVAFMKGIVGRYFFQFATTVAFAVLVSLFVSFTLDPMLSSRWTDPDIGHAGRRSWIVRLLDRFNTAFERFADSYKGMIAWSLDHRGLVILCAVLAFGLGLYGFSNLDTAFIPDYDRSEFQITFETAPDASIEETGNRLEVLLAKLKEFPEIHHTYATIGAGDAGTIRNGSIYVKLVEKWERKRDQDEMRRVVRDCLAEVPGLILSVESASHETAQKPLQIQVRGEKIDQLKAYARELKSGLKEIPGVVDLEVSMEFDQPEYRLVVDRKRAADAGVMTEDITQALATLVGGVEVSTFEDEEGEAIDVRLRLPQDLRQAPAQVRNLRIIGHGVDGGTTLLTLGELTTMEQGITPTEINRRGMTRQVVVSANLDGIPLGAALEKAQTYIDRLDVDPGYTVGFFGEADDMSETFRYMIEALLLAVISVYLILAAQFESFLDPLAIMLSLPLSILGMAGMLLITGDTVNIMSMIGLIMLMGLVTKNAILLVDYAKVLRKRGMERREALILSGRTRLRPIMMTTVAMIFGMAPMALKIGAGSEMRAPMARAVVGGLITSTFLTLLVIPVVYTFLDDVEKRLFGKSNSKKEERAVEMVVEL